MTSKDAGGVPNVAVVSHNSAPVLAHCLGCPPSDWVVGTCKTDCRLK